MRKYDFNCVILNNFNITVLNLRNNPLKDRKLFKYVDQNQAIKAIMDHIQKLGISSFTLQKDENEDNTNKSKQEEKEVKKIIIKKFDEDFKIEYDLSVKNIRGFILCCIVENLELTPTTFKEFLQFQTKLHDTLCKKRELATIATHDLGLISSNKHLRYAAKHKNDINIHPLKGSKIMTGADYFESLKREAENYRKEKKRSNVTGVYKFLDLLKDKDEFAFLETVDTHLCISLPPITNSDVTKMSINTKRILIEVTSNGNAAICNKIMSEIIQMLISTHPSGTLELQQTRIVFSDGTLKTIYPSKVDLNELSSEIIQVFHP